MAVILHEHFAVIFFLELLLFRETEHQKLHLQWLCVSSEPKISFLGQIWFCHRYTPLAPAMGWMFVFPPNLQCYILIPNVIVFEGELFRGWSVMNGISAFLKGNTENSFNPSVIREHRENLLFMNQKVGTHQTLKLPEIYPELTSLKESEKCFLLLLFMRHLVYVNLL